MQAETTLYNVETVLVTGLVAAYGLRFLVGRLRRHRPELAIGRPILVAFGLRVALLAVLSLTQLAPTLRGGDEIVFVNRARSVAEGPSGAGDWYYLLRHQLHEWVFAVQLEVLSSPEFALRVTQVAIATAGLALLATAVHDLAGRRAGLVAAWVLAIEPTSIFFSGLLHKEALMLLAEGMVALGGAALWTRGRLTSLVPMGAGCLVAVGTRPYAGWFLIAASAAITLHASARGLARGSTRGVALLSGVVLLVAVTGPTVWHATSDKELESLQLSQDANATDESNLKLERVDFSTRSAVISNLPTRIRDVLVRPYPWEVANASQRMGLLGTTFLAIGFFGFFLPAILRGRGHILRRAGPLAYVLAFLIAAYALAAGNAGTGFRYRTHIVGIGICLTVVVRAGQRRSVRAAEPVLQRPRRPLAVAR